MASFDHSLVEQVVASCQARIGEVTALIRRTLDPTLELGDPTGSLLEAHQLPEDCSGPGLLVALRVAEAWWLLALPESSGLIPEWCHSLNQSAEERLGKFAADLGGLVLPHLPIDIQFHCGCVPDLTTALRSAAVASTAARVAIPIRCADKGGTLTLLWPALEAVTAFSEPSPSSPVTAQPEQSAAKAPPESVSAAAPAAPQKRRIAYQELEDGIVQLPSYSRSLLKIKVPVMVTLAEAKQPVENVLAIGPGSIIHFNKPCEDSLALEIDGQKIALGEAVKVGDKFGLWITSMILPEERFWVISNRPHVERAK